MWPPICDCNADEYDRDDLDPVYIQGASFYEWLRDLVQRDGLPDGFIEVTEAGGFLDPA